MRTRVIAFATALSVGAMACGQQPGDTSQAEPSSPGAAPIGRPKVSGLPASTKAPKSGAPETTPSDVEATRSALTSPPWAPLALKIGKITDDAKSVAGLFSQIVGGVNAAITIARFLGLLAPADDEVADLSLKIDGIATGLTWQIAETARAQDWSTMVTGIETIQQFNSLNLTIDPMAAYITDTHTATTNSEQAIAFQRVFVDSATNGQWFSYNSALNSTPTTSYFQWKNIVSRRPTVTNGLVYDWRLGVPIMLKLIADRLAVIATIDPNFAIDHKFDQEITDHRNALINQYNQMNGAISCQTNDFRFTYSGPNLWTPGGSVHGCNITCADIYTGAAATTTIPPQKNPTSGLWYDSPCSTVNSATINNNEYGLTWQVNRLESLPTFETKSMINILYRFLHNAPDLTERYQQFEPDQASTRLCVDLAGDSTAVSVAPMVLEPCNGGDAQWWIYDRPTGLIFNPINGTCLTVVEGLPWPGVPVYAEPCSPTSGDPALVTDLSQAFTYDPEMKYITTSTGQVLYMPSRTAGSSIMTNNAISPSNWLLGPIVYPGEAWHADTAADPFP